MNIVIYTPDQYLHNNIFNHAELAFLESNILVQQVNHIDLIPVAANLIILPRPNLSNTSCANLEQISIYCKTRTIFLMVIAPLSSNVITGNYYKKMILNPLINTLILIKRQDYFELLSYAIRGIISNLSAPGLFFCDIEEITALLNGSIFQFNLVTEKSDFSHKHICNKFLNQMLEANIHTNYSKAFINIIAVPELLKFSTYRKLNLLTHLYGRAELDDLKYSTYREYCSLIECVGRGELARCVISEDANDDVPQIELYGYFEIKIT